MAEKKEKPGPIKSALMLAGIAFNVWIIWMGLSWIFGGEPTPIAPNSDKAKNSARFECRLAIEVALKDPDSAEWINYRQWPASYDDPLMSVAATVRAKNGFGGYVVEEFLCEMVTTDGKDFSSVNVVQLGR